MILYKKKTSIEIHVCLRLDVVIVRCLHLHSVVDGAEAVATGVHDRAHVHQKDIMISDFLSIPYISIAIQKAHCIMLQAVQKGHNSMMKAG